MPFTDNFNRASLGTDWVTVAGVDWIIAASTVLKPGGQYQAEAVRVVGTFPANQYAEVKCEIPTPGGGDPTVGGPAVRMNASGECYYVRFLQSDLALYKYTVAGGHQYLSDVAQAVSLDTLYLVRLAVTGTGLEIFVGGVSKLTHTDASIATGNPGCFALTGQTSLFPRFDDFECTSPSAGGVVAAIAMNRMRRGK